MKTPFCRFTALMLVLSLSSMSVHAGDKILGPGWHNVHAEPVAPGQTRDPKKSKGTPKGLSGFPVDEITTELTELARGLHHDPTLIYEFVRNHIDYTPYYGSTKGATLTLLERSGGDFDQCALMIALLRASGYTANYKFGTMDVPGNAVNNLDIAHWIPTEVTAAGSLIASGGIPATTFNDGMGGVAFIRMERVWVEVGIGGTNYLFDPAFKAYDELPGIDVTTALGYKRAALLAAAGGTTTTDYVQGLSSAAINNLLATYAGNLIAEIRNNHPNAEPDEVYGSRRIVPVTGAPMATTLPFPNTLMETWASIPDTYHTTVDFTFGNVDLTMPTGALNGRRLSLTFASGANPTGTLWLDDAVLAQETGAAAGSSVDLTIAVDHPYPGGGGFYQDQTETKAYQRDASYAIIYGFGGSKSGETLQRRRAKLDAYRESGLPDTSREVVTETLNVMGMSWMKQTSLALAMLDQRAAVATVRHHRFGRMGQEEGYYVDVGLQTGSSISKVTGAGADEAHFRASSLFASAMEHGVIEQLQGPTVEASSTVELLGRANDQGDKIFLANLGNYASIRPLLTNYSNGLLDFFQVLVDADHVIVLPEDGELFVNQWNGTGYIDYNNSGGRQSAGMIIFGGYFGGFAGDPGKADTDKVVEDAKGDPKQDNKEPSSSDNPTSPEPVDMATCAYLFEHTDLALGPPSRAGLSIGLSFARLYNSNRHHRETPLGFGWSHNFDSNIITRNAIEPALGLRVPVDAAGMAAGVTAALDLTQEPDEIKHWVSATLASRWAVDGLRQNSASVTTGDKVMEFVKLPDGTFSSPPGLKTVLSEEAGVYTLTERFGPVISFDANNRISTIVDADGNSITYTYNPDGTLQMVNDDFGHGFTFTYNSGHLQSVTDTSGRTVSYRHSPAGDLTGYTDPENKTWTYGYDDDHRINELRNPKNEIITQNLYDSLGRVCQQMSLGIDQWNFFYSPFLTTQEDPLGARTFHVFDDKTRLIATQDPVGNISAMEHDGQNHVVRLSDPENNTIVYEYDGNHNITKVTNPELHETTFGYDALLRHTTTTEPGNRTTTYEYDSEHHLTKIIDPLMNVTTFAYHPNGLLMSRQDPLSQTTSFTYDGFGNPDLTIHPDGSSDDSNFNLRGDLVRQIDANGHGISYTYNGRRNLLTSIDDLGYGVTVTYDSSGNVATYTDARGQTESFTYNALGTITSKTGPNGGVQSYERDSRNYIVARTDRLFRKTAFTYDSAGRLLTLRNPLEQELNSGFDGNNDRTTVRDQNNGTTTLVYDGLRRVTSLTSPQNKQTVFTYNSRGLLATHLEPSGQLRTYTYDDDGRLTRRVDPAGRIDYTYNDNSLPLTVTEGTATLTREHDNRDRLSRFIDAAGNDLRFTYDKVGNLKVITYPDNKTVTYTYDAADRMTTVTDWSNRVTSYTYDASGQLKTITRPNGTVRRLTYNAAGELTRIREEDVGASLIVNYDLTYDLAGRLVREDVTPQPSFLMPAPVSMSFDSDNRLTTFNGAAAVHDDDGNVTTGPLAGGTATFVYDSRNRLTSAGGTTYTYDSENRRTSLTNGGGTTTYVTMPGGPLSNVLVRNAPGSTTRYVYGRSGLLYEDNAGTTTTYHYDNNGNTVALTNPVGAVTDRIDYTPFGGIAKRTGSTDTPFLFNGRYGVETDSNGLYYMRARYYNPDTRRFLNPDPLGFGGGTNFYLFALNNPKSYLDPFGLEVYVGGRDLNGPPIGTHQFTTLVPDDVEAFKKKHPDIELVDIGDGRSGVIVGAYNTDKRLQTEFNEATDLTAARQGFNPDTYTNWHTSDFDTELHEVGLPEGVTNDQYIDSIISAARNYKKNEGEDNQAYPTAGLGTNSNSWNQTLHEVLGGDAVEDFNGLDWGHDKRLPHELFK